MIEQAELADLPSLKGISPAALARLASVMERRSCADRETVFGEGVGGGDLYLVGRGTVKINKRAKEGEAQSLAVLHEGDFLGIMSFLEGGAHSANAVASGATVLFVLRRPDFDRLLEEYPADGARLLLLFIDELVESLRRMNEKYIDMVNYMWRWR